MNCTYPDCKCPFDHTGEPNWCARGLSKRENTMIDELNEIENEYYARQREIVGMLIVAAQHQIKFYETAVQVNEDTLNRPVVSQANVWQSIICAMLANSRLDLTTQEVIETTDVVLSEFNKRFNTNTGDPNPENFTCDITV